MAAGKEYTLMRVVPPLPGRIAGIAVPQDPVSAETWRWAHRTLPDYLLTHSVRAYCWGAAIAAGEGWAYDAGILWTASLMHDVGLTRIRRNETCFEVEGAEIARRFLERHGVPAAEADRVAVAIVLHMQPSVTLVDGVESVLLDRATSLDVRGEGYELVDAIRPQVVGAFPAARLRSPFPRSYQPRGRHPPELPERPPAPSRRARRLDGPLAVDDRPHSRPWRLTATSLAVALHGGPGGGLSPIGG